MVKRTYNLPDDEPNEKMTFELPSEKEHLFQVTDVITIDSELGVKLNLTPDIVAIKCEIAAGDELGRTLLQRLALDEGSKGFFATRLFLKAVDLHYKGQGLIIDTDEWQGRQFFATAAHVKVKDKTYANIGKYNFDKKVDQFKSTVGGNKKDEIAWEE